MEVSRAKFEELAKDGIYYANLAVRTGEEFEEQKRQGYLDDSRQTLQNMLNAYMYAEAIWHSLKILGYKSENVDNLTALLKR